jgi:hypothetical protein
VALRKSATSSIPVLIAGLAWQSCGYTQDKPKAASRVPGDNSNVSCYEPGAGSVVGPKKMRTFVLESPDGTFRAYSQSEALLDKTRNAQGDEDVECENTSRLFVAGPPGHKFRQVMIVLPTPEPSGNNIGLVDWSPKGHRLLITEGRWGYDSDFGETTIRIYDADSDKLSSESFVQEAFRKHGGRDCIGVFQAVGFSEDGGIIVRAGPYFDEGEEHPRADSCVAKKGLWLIAPGDDAIRPLPDNYKPKHYGNEVPRELAE